MIDKTFNLLSAKKIVLLGCLIATEIIFSRFLSFETVFFRIGFSFLPLMLIGILFDPWFSGLSGILSDIFGMIIFPKNFFFVGFTLNAFLIPFIYSFYFYQKNFNLRRNILAQLSVMVLVSFFLTPIWLHLFFDIPILTLLPIIFLKECIILPVNIFTSNAFFSNKSFLQFVKKQRN